MELLAALMQWTLGIGSDVQENAIYDGMGSKRIVWLHGMAGSGKSTIANTVASLLQDGNHCYARFFCKRDLTGFFGLAPGDEDGGDAAGTVLPARNAGFLCVISLLSTLRRPLVTSAPRFRSAKTAATPPADGAGAGTAAGGGGGPGGGGGGGGGAPVVGALAVLYSSVETP